MTINAQEVPTNSTNLSFAKNIIACAAIAQELGLEWDAIIDRIKTFISPKGRCEIKNNGELIIIDDTYNANLESTIAAINYLKAFSGDGKRIFVFGDMLELGESSITQHQAIGEKCNDSRIDAVLTIGTETIATDGALLDIDFHRHFNKKDDLLKSLNEIVKDGDQVIVKGSRGMRMETIVEGMLI